MRSWITVGLTGLLVLLCGCGLGFNSLIFATKTNYGVDIDATPPAAEISIARHEGVIEPIFEDGTTLPVLASFNTELNGLQRLLFGTSSAFAVGDAAYYMAHCYATSPDCDVTQHRALLLSKAPTKRRSWFGFGEDQVDYHGPGFVAPVFFGTHSTFGLKVEWNGTTGQYPSALKLGYHRKELAWAPVTLKKADASGKCQPDQSNQPSQPVTTAPAASTSERVCAQAPSLLATMDSSGGAGQLEQEKDNQFNYLQYFATGDAATRLVQHQAVRQVMLKRLLAEVGVDTLADKIETNRKLGNLLAEKVTSLGAGDISKLRSVYFAAVDKRYIDPVTDATTGNPITTIDFAAHHGPIAKEFKDRAAIERPSAKETTRLKALLALLE